MSYCENCGCKVGRLGCVNCHEIEYIEEQVLEVGMPWSQENWDAAKSSREERKRQERIRSENA